MKNKSRENFWPPAQGVGLLENNEKRNKTTSVYRLREHAQVIGSFNACKREHFRWLEQNLSFNKIWI